ncbi:MAG TPA: protein kinase, partial [Thermoanaerobaculia bacterium]|nr:protein kinase [Thermoanaerobaculia bacterium]
MPLQSGTYLGPYQLEGHLGAGGMGEVYRARDTRLGRTVAVKVLPSRVAGRDDLRERFEREARAISLLNHPHICTLHDVGSATAGGEEIHFLVMEHIEGETLAARLDRGPLPLDQTIRYGIQIAEALDRAHRQGIIHRDLKPGNVMITRDGIKLLDFGLAKIANIDSGSDANAPTVEAVTAEGHIVGTLQYMSPEQLEGKRLDGRTDIFSLGVVLYEMVTGKRAFGASTHASLVASILGQEPPLISSIRPSTPPLLEKVISIALAKDPDDRWQSARDIVHQLRMIEEGVAAPRAAGSESWTSRRWRAAAIAFALLSAALGALTVWQIRRGSAAATEFRRHLTIELAHPIALTPNGFGAPFDLSSDGAKLVWRGGEEQEAQLYLRSLEDLDVTPLEGTRGVTGAFFSPRGDAVAFYADSQLKIVRLQGSTVSTVTAAGPGSGGVWMKNDTIIYSPIPGGGLFRVPVSGGTSAPVTKLEGDDAGHSWPAVLPDERTMLFTVEREGRSWDEAHIDAVDLETGKRKVVLHGAVKARFVGKDTLLFVRSGRLMSVKFDLKRVETVGEPSVLLEDVAMQPGTGGAFYAASTNGTVIYLRGGRGLFDTRVVWFDRSGKEEPLAIPPRTYVNPRISPDGGAIAFEVVGANNDIWLYDMQLGTLTRVTSKSEHLFPVWSPDGRRMITSGIDSGLPVMKFIDMSTGTASEAFIKSTFPQFACSWAEDGTILFMELNPETGMDLFAVDDHGRGNVRPWVKTRFDELAAAAAPQGDLVAYVSSESGVSEVYVVRGARDGAKIQVSGNGGREPVWASSGNELFFISGDSLLSAP